MKYVSDKDRQAVVKALKKGAILGVPTETVYGLAVMADNTAAIEKLLRLKNRDIDSGKVLTMMVAEVDDMKKYVKMTHQSTRMARHYFPGELTMVLPKHDDWSHPYFDNFGTVGIRIPGHDFMLDLLRETGPLLVTSANPRGEAPCRTSKELGKRMPNVDMIVHGSCGHGLPSTVIDLTADKPRALRQGGLLIVHY